eukprot:scaffold25.g5123.t1
MGKKARESGKAAGKASSKAGGDAPAGPPSGVAQAKALYQQFRKARDDKARAKVLAALHEAAAAAPSAAGCLALAKAHVQLALDLSIKKLRPLMEDGDEVESLAARRARTQQLASGGATGGGEAEGCMRSRKRCLLYGAHLLHVCRGRGSRQQAEARAEAAKPLQAFSAMLANPKLYSFFTHPDDECPSQLQWPIERRAGGRDRHEFFISKAAQLSEMVECAKPYDAHLLKGPPFIISTGSIVDLDELKTPVWARMISQEWLPGQEREALAATMHRGGPKRPSSSGQERTAVARKEQQRQELEREKRLAIKATLDERKKATEREKLEEQLAAAEQRQAQLRELLAARLAAAGADADRDAQLDALASHLVLTQEEFRAYLEGDVMRLGWIWQESKADESGLTQRGPARAGAAAARGRAAEPRCAARGASAQVDDGKLLSELTKALLGPPGMAVAVMEVEGGDNLLKDLAEVLDPPLPLAVEDAGAWAELHEPLAAAAAAAAAGEAPQADGQAPQASGEAGPAAQPAALAAFEDPQVVSEAVKRVLGASGAGGPTGLLLLELVLAGGRGRGAERPGGGGGGGGGGAGGAASGTLPAQEAAAKLESKLGALSARELRDLWQESAAGMAAARQRAAAAGSGVDGEPSGAAARLWAAVHAAADAERTRRAGGTGAAGSPLWRHLVEHQDLASVFINGLAHPDPRLVPLAPLDVFAETPGGLQQDAEEQSLALLAGREMCRLAERAAAGAWEPELPAPVLPPPPPAAATAPEDAPALPPPPAAAAAATEDAPVTMTTDEVVDQAIQQLKAQQQLGVVEYTRRLEARPEAAARFEGAVSAFLTLLHRADGIARAEVRATSAALVAEVWGAEAGRAEATAAAAADAAATAEQRREEGAAAAAQRAAEEAAQAAADAAEPLLVSSGGNGKLQGWAVESHGLGLLALALEETKARLAASALGALRLLQRRRRLPRGLLQAVVDTMQGEREREQHQDGAGLGPAASIDAGAEGSAALLVQLPRLPLLLVAEVWALLAGEVAMRFYDEALRYARVSHWDAEARLLRLGARCGNEHPVEQVCGLLGAHRRPGASAEECADDLARLMSRAHQLKQLIDPEPKAQAEEGVSNFTVAEAVADLRSWHLVLLLLRTLRAQLAGAHAQADALLASLREAAATLALAEEPSGPEGIRRTAREAAARWFRAAVGWQAAYSKAVLAEAMCKRATADAATEEVKRELETWQENKAAAAAEGNAEQLQLAAASIPEWQALHAKYASQSHEALAELRDAAGDHQVAQDIARLGPGHFDGLLSKVEGGGGWHLDEFLVATKKALDPPAMHLMMVACEVMREAFAVSSPSGELLGETAQRACMAVADMLSQLESREGRTEQVMEIVAQRVHLAQGAVAKFCIYDLTHYLSHHFIYYALPRKLLHQWRELKAEEVGETEAQLLRAAEEQQAAEAAARKEAERREAERKAAAAAAAAERKRAAAVAAAKRARGPGLSGKAAAGLDWRAELEDYSGYGEEEEGEGEEDDAVAAAARRREEERQRGLEQLMAQLEGEEGEDWLRAGGKPASAPRSPGRQQRAGVGARGGAQQQGRLLVMKRPARQQEQGQAQQQEPQQANGPAPAAGAGAAEGGSWSFNAPAAPAAPTAPEEQQAQAQGKSWAAMAAAAGPGGGGGEEEDLAGLLATMGVGGGGGGEWGGAAGEEEDENLRRALAASLAEAPPQGRERAPSAGGGDAAAPAAAAGDAGDAGAPAELPAELEGLGLAGLSNAAGEYNCFLNVIIQCLWSCVEFRHAAASWPREACATDDVVAALQGLFQQYGELARAGPQEQQAGEAEAACAPRSPAPAARAGGAPISNGTTSPTSSAPPSPGVADAAARLPASLGPTPPASPAPPVRPGTPPPPPSAAAASPGGGSWAQRAAAFPARGEAPGGGGATGAPAGAGVTRRRKVLNPTPLREALAALPTAQFQVGEMSDAGEVLLTIYEHIGGVSQEAADQVDACFGLRVREAVHCGQCGRTTQQNEYTQFFFNTQATSLRVMGPLLGEGGSLSLGSLLRQIESQHQKSCNTDVGGCGAPNPITHVLQGEPPRVFSLQLAWESNQVAPADIAATMQQVQEALDVGELYCGVEPGAHTYRLRAMACYYGAHYMAFVFTPDLAQWLLFDDAAVSRIGAWPDVVRKCEAGRIQPCVLFFEAVEAAEAPAAAAAAP